MCRHFEGYLILKSRFIP